MVRVFPPPALRRPESSLIPPHTWPALATPPPAPTRDRPFTRSGRCSASPSWAPWPRPPRAQAAPHRSAPSRARRGSPQPEPRGTVSLCDDVERVLVYCIALDGCILYSGGRAACAAVLMPTMTTAPLHMHQLMATCGTVLPRLAATSRSVPSRGCRPGRISLNSRPRGPWAQTEGSK